MSRSTESFRIKKALLSEVRKVAKTNERTVTWLLERWIREGLNKYEKENEHAVVVTDNR